MSSVCLIMAEIKLPISLWRKILKTVAYLKICSLTKKDVTAYNRVNEDKTLTDNRFLSLSPYI